jgi:ribose 5-phosphate isomerase B
MKIYIGSDHRGYALSRSITDWLNQRGEDTTVLGDLKPDPEDDYVDFASAVGRKVSEEDGARGIVVCGSGVGVDIASNKIPGVRSCLGYSVELVKSGRNDDDVNVLSLGSDFISFDSAKGLIDAFLHTPFSGEDRHMRRIEKIKQLED